MGLVQLQHMLARLYTDDTLREQFFADPQRHGERLGLSPAEARQLAQLSPHDIRFFAASLRHKRLQVIQTFLPLTHHVLGARLPAIFQTYTTTPLAQGMTTHRQDALALARYLVRLGQQTPCDPPWLVDLVRYEAACLSLHSTSCLWLLRTFRYPVLRLAEALVQGIVPSRVPVQPLVLLWWRLPGQAYPRRWVVWGRGRPHK